MTDNPSPLADLESTVELLWHYCTGVTPDTPEIRHLARALLLAVEAGRRLPRLNDKTQGPLFSLDEFIEPSANSPQP